MMRDLYRVGEEHGNITLSLTLLNAWRADRSFGTTDIKPYSSHKPGWRDVTSAPLELPECLVAIIYLTIGSRSCTSASFIPRS